MAENKRSYNKHNQATKKYTVEMVREAVDRLIADYEESRIMPTDYRLQTLVGVKSARTVDKWYSGEADIAPSAAEGLDPDREEGTYKAEMCRLIEFRRQIVVDTLGGGAANKYTGIIFLGKQPRWGGFQDVQQRETKGSADIKITLTGSDGKPVKV